MKRLLIFTGFVLYLSFFSDPVVAEMDGRETAVQAVASAIGLHVAEQLSVDVSEIEVTALTAMNGQKGIQEGKVLNVRPANHNRFLGRAIFVVRGRSEAGHPFEQWVSADVSRLLDVVVTDRKLRRLDVIQVDDVRLQRIRIRRTRNRYLFDPEEVIGKRLTQSLRKDIPIRSEQLEIAPLVRRGDRVTITFKSGGLQIVTSGQAKQDGHLGEMIRVINLDSKKTVFAEVMRSGDVQIALRAKE